MKSQPSQIAWHYQSGEDVLETLDSNRQGLTEAEARRRLSEFGPNSLPHEPPKSALAIFLAQFKNPLMLILVIALAVSLALLEWLDATVIGIAILLNVTLGFFEEYKADRSMHALQSYLPQKVKVRRDGEIQSILAQDLVPGDIVLYTSGDQVTADGRILSKHVFEVSEAALTGESSPIKKQVEPAEIDAQVSDRVSMVFAGTVVTTGNAEVVVAETGLNTELGRITSLVQSVEDEATPLQEQLKVFARYLGLGIVGLSALVFVVGIWQDFDLIEMLKIGIALTVSAIPEGLIVAVTVILAIGMQRILKKKALVRKLVAAETLGSVSVICADKTGTLTTGEMAVEEVRIERRAVDLSEDQKTELLRQALIATSGVILETDHKTKERVYGGTPTEVALWKYAESFDQELEKEKPVAELPFSAETKFAAGIVRTGSSQKLFVVGAPEVLLDRADISDSEKQAYLAELEDMTQRGLRVLMAAEQVDFGEVELSSESVKDLKIIGQIGLRDPLRPHVAATIRQARAAGLRPVMITGDHPETALRIAKRAGLDGEESNLITGTELDRISDEELFERLPELHVFARVMPKHKVRIVKAWQKRGASVAMTGDGVNDAPALKAADIGIALGSGTEVAKETSDMVLLDNSFKTIVAAVREGRIIFDNIRKMMVYLLSDSFSEVILVLGALALSLPLPILPAQILWINLITDGFPSIALTFEPGEKGIMKDPPRQKKEPILNWEMIILIFIIGIITDLLLFGIYLYLLNGEVVLEEIRTFIYVALGLDSLIYIFAVRKFRSTIFRSHPFQNKYLLGGVLIGFIMLVLPLVIVPLRELFDFTVLHPYEWLILLVIALIDLIMIEIIKEIFNLRRNRSLRRAQNRV